jgi:hypothetical protein
MDFLCETCSTGGDEGFVDWLAEVPEAATSRHSLSATLWKVDECSKGHSFPPLVPYWPRRRSTAPDIVELVLSEASAIATGPPGAYSTVVVPLVTSPPPGGKRTGTPLDAITWIALAVAAGVLGNMSYDGIKRGIKDAANWMSRRAENRPGNDPARRVVKELDELGDDELSRVMQEVHRYVEARLRGINGDGEASADDDLHE